MKINKMLFVSTLLFALPVFAAEGVPGATITNDGAKPPYGAGREACKADPEKCKAALQARREVCKADPEKCRQDRAAMREKMCAQNPEKCKEQKARMAQRREACKADPGKCRQERQARAAGHFKKSDANKDGQLSRDEMSAARKAHHGDKAPGKSR